MARQGIHRLSPMQVKNAKAGTLLCDGGGLWIRTKRGKHSKTQSGIFRFRMPGGKEQLMGLGSTDTFSLAELRERAAEARKLKASGINPLEAKRARIAGDRAAKDAEKVAALKAMTVEEATKQYIAAHEAAWTRKVWREWVDHFRRHVHPLVGDLPVASVDTALVMKVLDPIWREQTRTASRVRGRLERVLGWAATKGLRPVENPARWKAHLENLLPAPSRLRNGVERHHESLPYQEIGAVMARLRALDYTPGRGALEFLILTATRSGVVRSAEWCEIDPAQRVWTIPAAKMKTRAEHRVPLSDAAVEVLRKAAELRFCEYVFPSPNSLPLDGNDMQQRVLKGDLGLTCATHGFRATFRTWADEQTSAPHHVMEQALAHKIASGVERAYRRGDLFDKRRKLMDQWARYCATSSALKTAGDKVVPMFARNSA